LNADFNPRGGLTVDRDSLHASPGYARQVEAAKQLRERGAHADVEKAVEALRNYTQADADGVMVTVSRQACDEAANEIELLQSESRASDDLRERLAAILTATANALKGEPKPLHVHSWHDLAEVAAKVVVERDALQARIEGAPILDGYQAAIIHMGGRTINVVSADLVGKRVALVVLEDGK
jgi:hypothetical protein